MIETAALDQVILSCNQIDHQCLTTSAACIRLSTVTKLNLCYYLEMITLCTNTTSFEDCIETYTDIHWSLCRQCCDWQLFSTSGVRVILKPDWTRTLIKKSSVKTHVCPSKTHPSLIGVIRRRLHRRLSALGDVWLSRLMVVLEDCWLNLCGFDTGDDPCCSRPFVGFCSVWIWVISSLDRGDFNNKVLAWHV